MTRLRLATTIFLFFGLMIGLAGNAHAYIDPGTGSYILQLLAAALLGAMFTLRLYWARVKTFFQTLTTKTRGEDERNPEG